MNLFQRSVPAVAALGLVAAGLLAAPTGAATAATTPTCQGTVAGVLPSGKLMYRSVQNTKITSEVKTASPLPFSVESLYGGYSEPLPDNAGSVAEVFMHGPGRPARVMKVKYTEAGPTLSATSYVTLRPTPKGRSWADSGRFYSYAITPNGNLTRFTRQTDDRGHFWLGSPKVVKTAQGAVRTMSYSITVKNASGVRADILYVTTRGGALKQIQVPWGSPGKAKVTTLRKSGFGAVTSLSLSFCDAAGRYASIVAVERGNNRARWWTLAGQFSPKPANLTRRPLVAPGAEWRLKASY